MKNLISSASIGALCLMSALAFAASTVHDFALDSLKGKGTIKSAVVDRSGAFIVNASVKLYRRGQKAVVATAHTDVTGTFQFFAVEPDTYDLVIDAPGFKLKRIGHISIANGSEIELPLNKLESLGIVLDNPPG